MIPPLKPGAKLMQADGPFIETARLILRPWRSSDIAANTAMLSDPDTARFITPDGKVVTPSWADGAMPPSSPGIGRCMASPCSRSRKDRVANMSDGSGHFRRRSWPGFEVGWGIARECRGKGYAVEAARASIDWVFATFEIDEIIHCIDDVNAASQAVARRLGARRRSEGCPDRQACRYLGDLAPIMDGPKLNRSSICT